MKCRRCVAPALAYGLCRACLGWERRPRVNWVALAGRIARWEAGR